METREALERLVGLHDEVDRDAGALVARHEDRLHCERGCHSCCVDEITVFEIEAERIRRAHPDLLAKGAPHPPGACAFLDAEGACRIYADRPYVCRTQGLPLRWIAEDASGELVEARDICPLNLEGVPLEELPEEACWTLGPVELRLGQLQEEADGGERTRIPLRSLFERSAETT